MNNSPVPNAAAGITASANIQCLGPGEGVVDEIEDDAADRNDELINRNEPPSDALPAVNSVRGY